MRLGILFVLLSVPALSQISIPSINFVTSDPSGSCPNAPPMQYNYNTGLLWACDSGTWAKIGGSGGGATIPSTTHVIKGDGAGNGA